MRVRMCVRVYMYILFPRLREHILHKRTHSIHHMSFVLREHILHKGTHHVHLFERGERLCQLLLFPPRLCLPDCLLVLGMQLLHERVARRLRAYSRQKSISQPRIVRIQIQKIKKLKYSGTSASWDSYTRKSLYRVLLRICSYSQPRVVHRFCVVVEDKSHGGGGCGGGGGRWSSSRCRHGLWRGRRL